MAPLNPKSSSVALQLLQNSTIAKLIFVKFDIGEVFS